MIKIAIIPESLTDKSRVWNVHFGTVELHAYSESDANLLAEKILAAIDEHTADAAKIIGNC